jgi:hypothetical protein
MYVCTPCSWCLCYCRAAAIGTGHSQNAWIYNYSASVEGSKIERFWSFFLKTWHAIYGDVTHDRKIQSCSQSYNRELQRQRCKNYNAAGSLVCFVAKKIFYTLWKMQKASYDDAGDVAVNSEVVGLAPDHELQQHTAL